MKENIFLKKNTKSTSLDRFEEVLKTVNPKTVKEIDIQLTSSCSSDMPSWADVKIGYYTYILFLADMDDRYWADGIECFIEIIKKVVFLINQINTFNKLAKEKRFGN